MASAPKKSSRASRAREIALYRYALIRPLADPGLSPAERGGVHGQAAADRDVAECGGEVGFADSDRPEDEHAVAGFGEPQGGQVGEQLAVVGEVVELVPGVQPHRGVQPSGTGA